MQDINQEISLKLTRKLSLLAGFHRTGRCSTSCWGRKAISGLIQHGGLQAATLTCRQSCSHGCNSGMKLTEVTNQFLLQLEVCSIGLVACLLLEALSKAHGLGNQRPQGCCFDKWSFCHTAFLTIYVYTHRFVLLSTLVREASFSGSSG